MGKESLISHRDLCRHCNLIFINRTFRPTHVLSFLFHFLRTSRTIFLLAHRLVMYHSLCKSCLILRSAWEITINRFCRTPRTHRDAAAVPSLFSLVFRSHHQLTQNYGTLQCIAERTNTKRQWREKRRGAKKHKKKKKRKENFYRNLIKLRVKCNRIVLLVVQKNINRICERGHFVCLFIRFPYWVILSTEKKKISAQASFLSFTPRKVCSNSLGIFFRKDGT